jgi:uncharacterized repeat protein (TIGR01451 family)
MLNVRRQRPTVLNTANVVPPAISNVLTGSGSATVNLFEPSVTIDKTGDTLSKVGDDVNYTIIVTNTSSADTPHLVCTVTDPVLGINKAVTLASGAQNATNAVYTVQAGDSDPLLNTASVSCSPIGFRILRPSDGRSANLFQPSIRCPRPAIIVPIRRQATALTLWMITLNNTSSADTPDLTCAVTDAKLGINKAVTLASGAFDTTSRSTR